MKLIPVLFGAALVSLLAGCASTPVVLAPVGPRPVAVANAGSRGQLEVFSAMEGHTEGVNPSWYQHTDYTVYDLHGRRLRRVDNSVGYYERRPRVIALPVGQYIVKAQAEDYFSVEVPVVIEAGRTTRVHLDGDWRPSPAAAAKELVSAPAGYPVGWRAARNAEVD